MNKYYPIIFLVALSACKPQNNKSIKEVEYQMVSYESKAWVDSFDFPLIKIINGNSFKIYQRDVLKHEGKVDLVDKKMFLTLNNGQKLSVNFLDADSQKIRVSRLVDINIEAKYGDFIKVE